MFSAHHILKLNYLVVLLAILFLDGGVSQVESLNFSFPIFVNGESDQYLLCQNSYISNQALQVTPDVQLINRNLSNMSGRAFYHQTFRLSDKQRGMKAPFTSTFVFNTYPITAPGGEGLAFILTADKTIPSNSMEQYLGIVNESTVGVSAIVAVEFDTSKSYREDVDDNHVGVDVNSIYSIAQEPLSPHGVNLSSGVNVTARVQYDARSDNFTVHVGQGERGLVRVLSVNLDLSKHLPEYVFVGFSASIGTKAQLNAVLSWNFTSTEYYNTDGNSAVNNLLWLWILISLIGIIVLGFFFFFGVLYWKRGRKNRSWQQDDLEIEQEIQGSSTAPSRFRLKDLIEATGNFSDLYKLGKGGFGMVYKGFLNNKEVAVKRLSKNSRHGKQDFMAEVTTIGNLHHKNLVKLLGWCCERNEHILVYEFMPNGSLDKLIFCNDKKGQNEGSLISLTNLNWERSSIICGVARAVDYLHNGCEKRVLHRDIKPSNVMLDSNFNARLGDFGLARIIQMCENTHHSTKGIAGTPGYMSPESFHTNRATTETDVYAFGVLILEVVCGKRPGGIGNQNYHEVNNHSYDTNSNSSCSSIVDWVWEFYRERRVSDIVHSSLDGVFEKDQAEHLVMLGLACCHPNPYHRPTMRSVLMVLTGEAPPPVVPDEKPAFVWPATPSAVSSSTQSLEGGLLTQTIEFSGR